MAAIVFNTRYDTSRKYKKATGLDPELNPLPVMVPVPAKTGIKIAPFAIIGIIAVVAIAYKMIKG
jgi:hypothetical protein